MAPSVPLLVAGKRTRPTLCHSRLSHLVRRIVRFPMAMMHLVRGSSDAAVVAATCWAWPIWSRLRKTWAIWYMLAATARASPLASARLRPGRLRLHAAGRERCPTLTCYRRSDGVRAG
jgi:hypothetical protein